MGAGLTEFCVYVKEGVVYIGAIDIHYDWQDRYIIQSFSGGDSFEDERSAKALAFDFASKAGLTIGVHSD